MHDAGPWPTDPAALIGQIQAHFAAGRFRQAAAGCHRGLSLLPGNPVFAVLLFNTAAALGDMEPCWKPMLAAAPLVGDRLEFLSGLASVSNSSVSAAPDEVFRCHAMYGQALERLRPGPGLSSIADPNPDRPLKIGLVSYDFRRQGSVGFFLSPLFTHRDRTAISITAYQTRPLAEADTGFFRVRADRWRQVPEAKPDEIARAISADGIDIAIDINGHSGVPTMPAFQPRCAPVQVSYLGYPNTSGCRAFDWRIVDSLTDPPPPHASDRLATERLFRLDPCFICYTPGEGQPAASPLPPSSTRGQITFGALSELTKLNDHTLGLWSQVLGAVPGSRLLLKNRALESPEAGAHLRARLTAAGIAPDRVDLMPRTRAFADHLAVYNQIDIALDTSPYNGTTTVCESLTMGVPLITFRPPAHHDRHAARVALSLLTVAGLTQFIAKDPADFVVLAASLARDRERLAAYRATLRARLLSSPVCDAPAFCRRFEAALRHMWRDRCAAGIPR